MTLCLSAANLATFHLIRRTEERKRGDLPWERKPLSIPGSRRRAGGLNNLRLNRGTGGSALMTKTKGRLSWHLSAHPSLLHLLHLSRCDCIWFRGAFSTSATKPRQEVHSIRNVSIAPRQQSPLPSPPVKLQLAQQDTFYRTSLRQICNARKGFSTNNLGFGVCWGWTPDQACW